MGYNMYLFLNVQQKAFQHKNEIASNIKLIYSAGLHKK